MTPFPTRSRTRALLTGALLGLLAGCDNGGFDLDFRDFGSDFDTSDAALRATAQRPDPDARGVISYPTYQVAVARRGDTVRSVADRVGLPAADLARYNAVTAETLLREGEIMALPRRVAESAPAGAAATGGAPGQIDVTALATGAIDRAEASGGRPPAAAPAGQVPTRHKVTRGETAYSIARSYDVPVRALADWNGLGSELTVREGQFLLIPVAGAPRPAAPDTAAPGQGSPTPEPPSAAKPLPDAPTVPAATAAPKPAAPNLEAERTAASGKARLAFPVSGKIIRPYAKKTNEGIDIAAAAGTAVKAAEAGTVAAITQDTEQVPILVIRHADGLLTVYANIEGVTVAKGAKVQRGQTIARVRASDPSFLHFEVRQGFDSVDPMPFLQ